MKFQSALAALGATAVAAVKPLEVVGRNFVNPDSGDIFQIVGMAYQIGGSSGYEPSKGLDPLSHPKVCMRDAALMQELGVNTIRVYNLNPDLNHDECASIFNAAGIYMILDVNSPKSGESLNNVEPWTSYHEGYLNRTFAVVEAFKSYPNTLAFFSGNEVIWDQKAAGIVPQYMRSVTRDIKNYVKAHCDRPIPVGYSAADVRPILEDSYNYLSCSLESEGDNMSQADIFALNSYSWCGDATYQSSGYNVLTNMFKDTPIPVFFSEFGCNTPSPRVFSEISAIYGPQMTKVFSGGIVYEYSMEANTYGLAKINDGGDESANLLKDFRTLQKQYEKIDFKEVQNVQASDSKGQQPKCSPSLIKKDVFMSNFTMLPPPPGVEKIIKNGVKPKPSGKIVNINNWNVEFDVKDVDGSQLSNLAVVPLENDAVNTPGTNTGSQSQESNNEGGDDEGAASGLTALSFTLAIPAILAAALI